MRSTGGPSGRAQRSGAVLRTRAKTAKAARSRRRSRPGRFSLAPRSPSSRSRCASARCHSGWVTTDARRRARCGAIVCVCCCRGGETRTYRAPSRACLRWVCWHRTRACVAVHRPWPQALLGGIPPSCTVAPCAHPAVSLPGWVHGFLRRLGRSRRRRRPRPWAERPRRCGRRHQESWRPPHRVQQHWSCEIIPSTRVIRTARGRWASPRTVCGVPTPWANMGVWCSWPLRGGP